MKGVRAFYCNLKKKINTIQLLTFVSHFSSSSKLCRTAPRNLFSRAEKEASGSLQDCEKIWFQFILLVQKMKVNMEVDVREIVLIVELQPRNLHRCLQRRKVMSERLGKSPVLESSPSSSPSSATTAATTHTHTHTQHSGKYSLGKVSHVQECREQQAWILYVRPRCWQPRLHPDV